MKKFLIMIAPLCAILFALMWILLGGGTFSLKSPIIKFSNIAKTIMCYFASMCSVIGIMQCSRNDLRETICLEKT